MSEKPGQGQHSDLDKAYAQLKRYADALDNPPLLIVSDMRTIVIHAAFTNTVKQAHVFTLSDLEDPAKRARLKQAFTNPEQFRPGLTRHAVTAQAAEQFSQIAHVLHKERGLDPHRIAHFLNRLIFCMFAEDVGVLPNKIFSKMVKASVAHPETFEPNASSLFSAMSKGGVAGFEKIDWFNGGLFDDDTVLTLNREELELLDITTDLDWSAIEPSILGTLFERGLDPDKRSQQGAHYTDPETIMRLVDPVILVPWEAEWELEKPELAKLIDKAEKKIPKKAADRFNSFLERLRAFRVLDPACGSGNFLFLALRSLKNFEKRVMHEAEALGFPPQFPAVGPECVLGIEVNPYAAELARVSIWIGELQWQIENGFEYSKNPILRPLQQIECRDAVLNEDGTEPSWPTADVIIGNPPFLGNRKLIGGLGTQYSEALRDLYNGRVSRGADLCCYWFEKARAQVGAGDAKRVGLVGTAAIRAGKNREVMDRIVSESRIFAAWSDQPWVNEGAAVRVSLVCFGEAACPGASLDGLIVDGIYSDLTPRTTGSVDTTARRRLIRNLGIAFQGNIFVGPFDITGEQARAWLQLPRNPNGRPNADVLAPCVNTSDIVGRSADDWVIDFGEMEEHSAALYEAPYSYALDVIKPTRVGPRASRAGGRWWVHHRSRPEFKSLVQKLPRYIATPRVSSHRVFVWLHPRVVPDTRVFAIARSDDTAFGILHSRIHEVWSLATCSWHGVGNDPTYNTECFETFPFPENMGPEVAPDTYRDSPAAQRISDAAIELISLRDSWLNPPELIERKKEVVDGYPDRILPINAEASKELKGRTLTKLYNTRPAWLSNAHNKLDHAVAAAYGWTWPLTDEEIVARLFDLNQQRATAQVNAGQQLNLEEEVED